MKRISLILVFSVMALSALKAQVLSVSPVFPKETDTVTIVYNAKLGNGALVGVSRNRYGNHCLQRQIGQRCLGGGESGLCTHRCHYYGQHKRQRLEACGG
ncbi:MAG: hypothetical protein EBT66_09530 [Bacteroidetes bacterium]|nr:hypothetical protein [Bacteroidota bacterium]